ncbi:MAG: hypothetical protein JWN86_3150 [Planctomycetota bacterium]|nr:hypothetical protein [Planctomycetota bacterium]
MKSAASRTPIALAGLAVLLAIDSSARADVKVPNLFTSHMVLQRDMKDKVWGWADKGEEVTVSINGQTKTTKAGDDGKWSVMLDPMPAGGPHTLTIKGKNEIKLDDVLVGEVWICSGQSNMQWDLGGGNDGDLESLSAKYPKIRLISVPQVGTQEPKDNFNGKWELCTPQTARQFSAVGYLFGRQLHQTLDVPIGLIDNSWGGSSCETWIKKDVLAADPKYKDLLDKWKGHEKEGDNQQPANIYNGVLKPTIGYGIRGAVWYQGETNAGRAYQYRDLFPLMIKSWRDEWGIGDFSFYYVQLADFLGEKAEPSESSWAELREAQTMTMSKLPKVGEAVIIDIGEGRDIHPRNKQDVAKRLARWALAKDYGIDVPHRSPAYKSMETKDGKVIVTLEHLKGGLYAFDVPEVRGFAIAGADKKFVKANAKIVDGNKVEVWADGVKSPVAVRYAWADNPVCNLYDRSGLPVTPFRTDDWPGVTINNTK